MSIRKWSELLGLRNKSALADRWLRWSYAAAWTIWG